MSIDITSIPPLPGVYIFKDSREKVLYIGKAKNLKNRLKAYFHSTSNLDQRKAKMAKMIRNFSYIVTSNELEAFILEATLIKEYKPKYNVVLRDDKNYPYIKLTINEVWPRLEVVRKISRDGNLYFGPYIPAQVMRDTLDFIRRNFFLRACKDSLDEKRRPCIQFQMKKCLAPCSGGIRRDEYLKIVEDVRLFLSGEKKELIQKLENRMFELSEEMRFEEAAKIRDRIGNIKKAFESQKVISTELGDMDVFGLYREGNSATVQILFVRNGVLIGVKDYYIDNLITDNNNEIMEGVITSFYSRDRMIPSLILSPHLPEDSSALIQWLRNKSGESVSIEKPTEGKKLELLQMATENAQLLSRSKKSQTVEEITSRLKERFKFKNVPSTIGAFDVSTIQGSESVGAYVFWENGEFRKENYRRFKIKSVEGVDDYGMLREIIGRTFKDSTSLIPNLIIIDGGKTQLSAGREVLESLDIDCEIIAIAKNPDRAFLSTGEVVSLEDKSRSSALLKNIRDEVHRFAITYHRKLRDKRIFESPLEKIGGIGKKRRLELLKHFGSIENIRMASVEEIAKIKGFNFKLAKKIVETLKLEPP
ncbi:MAG: excinuclease ABC subunit UvrC [Thermodesulfovibrionales bacterium]|nr:excinuclease ABC subunit UvrC [Thermodesulfovibrionales bacterium]